MSEAEAKSTEVDRDRMTLNELIEVTRDGQRFYEEAADRIEDDTLEALFLRMIESRSKLIEELSEHVASLGGKPATGGSISGTLQTLYGELRAGLAADRSAGFVSQLEDAEDRLLHAFEHAIANHPDETVRAILTRHFPTVRSMHDEMRNLKINLTN